MLENIVENKVKVFISSKCDYGKYTIMRRGLKELLVNTGFVDVYIFEDGASSSICVEESYMQELDTSDLCVFIIENSEEITEGVLKEYKRAKDLGKKSIYFFCDENSKDKTEIQIEIEEMGLQRYRIVHEFSEIIHEAFRAIMQDITNMYKYKNNINEKIKIEKTEENSEITVYKIKKLDSRGLQATNAELLKEISTINKIDDELSEFDLLCAEFLKVVLRRQKINDKQFQMLKSKILEMYDGNFKELISNRLEAVRLYYNGHLEQCICKLRNIIEKKRNDIPEWVFNDIAIDLRNLQNLHDEMNNKICFENYGQKYINNSKETVYYPLIDRIDDNRKKDILKELINYKLDSPYTKRIGNINYTFNYISLCFYIALTNGSITHLKLTFNRIIETLLMLDMKYDDHDLYVQTIKFLILNQQDKEIGKLLRTYRSNIDVINSTDVNKIYDEIQNTEIEYYKVISECLLLKYFNLYFSDKQYSEIFSKICNNIMIWINNENKIINYGYYYFDMLKNNMARGDIKKIYNIVINIFDKKIKRFYDNVLEIVQRIDYSVLTNQEQEKLMKYLISIMKDNKSSTNINKLQDAIISFKKRATITKDKLDTFIYNEMPKNFIDMYKIETENNNLKYKRDYIDECINKIHKENMEQGKNGLYTGGASNQYITIRNIIKYDNLILTTEKIKQLMDILIETLVSETQTISAKNSAVQLIIFLKKKFYRRQIWKKYIQTFIKDKDKFICGNEDTFLNNESIQLLKININLLYSIFNIKTENGKVDLIVDMMQLEDYEKIKVLEAIYYFLDGIDYTKIEDKLIEVILQYSTIMCNEPERDIRFWAAKCLIQLTYSKYKQVALRKLTNIMNLGSSELKITIISRVKEISMDTKSESLEFIINKGKVDNNFLVRKIAIDYGKGEKNNENKE